MDLIIKLLELAKFVSKRIDEKIIFAFAVVTILTANFWQVETFNLPTRYQFVGTLILIRKNAPLEFIAVLYFVVLPIAVWLLRFTRLKNYRKSKNELAQFKRESVSKFDVLGQGGEKSDIARLFVEPYLLQTKSYYIQDYQEEVTINQLFQRMVKDGCPGMFIWGPTGSGKSVLAKKIVYELSAPAIPRDWFFLKRKFEHASPHSKVMTWFIQMLEKLGLKYTTEDMFFPFPVHVSLKDLDTEWKGDEISSADLIISVLKKKGYQEFAEKSKIKNLQGQDEGFEHWLNQGLVIPVFDGLDELKPQSRQAIFLNSLYEFIRHPVYQQNTPFVVTLRDPNLISVICPDLQTLPFWKIMPFRQQQINQFIENYFGGKLEADGKEPQAAREDLQLLIVNTADRNPGARRIFSDPMLLTMIAQLFKYEKSFPNPSKKSFSDSFEDNTPIVIFKKYTQKLLSDLNGSFLTVFAAHLLEKEIDRDYPLPGQNKAGFERVKDILLSTTPDNRWYFMHKSFKDYFAAINISERLETLDIPITLQKGLTFPDETIIQNENAKIERYSQMMYWRNTVTLAVEFWVYEHFVNLNEDERAGKLTKFLVESKTEKENPIRQIMSYLYNYETLQAKVCLLRILSTLKVHVHKLDTVEMLYRFVSLSAEGDVPMKQREELSRKMMNWVLDFYEKEFSSNSYSYWRYDLVEVAQGLPDFVWSTLSEGLKDQDKATSEKSRRILVELPHPQSAERLLDALDEKGIYLDDVSRIIADIGFWGGNSLVMRGKKAFTAHQYLLLSHLITLLGRIGYLQSTWTWLEELLDYDLPPHIHQEIFLACTEWGQKGVECLKIHLYKAINYLHPRQDELVMAYGNANLELNEVSDLVDRALGPRETPIRDINGACKFKSNELCVRIIRYKFQTAQRELVIKLLEDKIAHYQPTSAGRSFLGWLFENSNDHRPIQKPSLLNKLSARSYDFFRRFDQPSRNVLQGVTNVCNELDNDFSKEWFRLCLQDVCPENEDIIKSAFVNTSAKRSDHLEWLYDFSQKISEELYLELDQLIVDAVKGAER